MDDKWHEFGTNKDFLQNCYHKYLWEFIVENFSNNILTQVFLQKSRKFYITDGMSAF